ncbi:hypothetical protein C5167_007951 [Papaver somniferum]|uniref:Agglutinin domain-containing protein n=1 Tax=Papaver somniferum TaxID=3469 RepID=A0A4Y7JWA8_PAPSO|nr:uncharacterized protein LOC113286520 [Papaver somniferum]RZC64261.1 hypothetical protein C5167_007951 [Papaver somniferum]
MKPTSSSLCKFKPLVIPPPVDGGGVGVAVPLSENSGIHAIMAEALPRYVILQSDYNDKYLRSVEGNSQVPLALKFGGEYSFDRDTRFELEKGKNKDAAGLFNIRCMYNNKYLSTVSATNNWITAVAADPEEDQTKWSCTLFQPVFVTAGDNTMVRFRHMATGNFACLQAGASTLVDCLKADRDGYDKFLVINWESVVMFPNRMVLKGDNGNYLLTGTDEYLGFSIGRLRGTDTEFEVTPSRNGGIRIKSLSSNMFWSNKNSLWVFANGSESSDKTTHKTENVFLPVKYAENVVALRGLVDNLYCKRLTAYDKVDCLGRVNKYADEYSRLVIADPVLSRKIDNVVFRIPAANTTKGKPVVLINKRVENNTLSAMTVAIDLRISDVHSSTWNASLSLSLGVKTTMTSGVPEVAEASIEFSVEFTSSYEWGETVEREVQMGSVYTVEVPSKSIVTASLIAVQGTAGIPFSYTQTDILSDGTEKIYEKDDGWFVGANAFNETFKVEQTAIPTAKL